MQDKRDTMTSAHSIGSACRYNRACFQSFDSYGNKLYQVPVVFMVHVVVSESHLLLVVLLALGRRRREFPPQEFIYYC